MTDYKELLNDPSKFQTYFDEVTQLSEELEADKYDSLQYSNPYKKELKRLGVIKNLTPFVDKITVEQYRPGLVIINKRFIVSLSNNIWRVTSKNTWYNYKSIEQLITKYVLKE